MVNLYWPVYQNIEHEVTKMTRTIHFCDEQVDTYSTQISDLLFRCSVEIESISKELFNAQFKVGDEIKIGKSNETLCQLGTDSEWRSTNKKGIRRIQHLYFDHNCIAYLSDKWNLKERQVIINCTNMFFIEDKFKILLPLSESQLKGTKSGKARGGWLKSYQGIKHSRIKNQNLGSVYYLLNAMAALYILNIYYEYDKKSHLSPLGLSPGEEFDLKCGSKVFTTTRGESVRDIFINQYNSLELNTNQKVEYVEIDVDGQTVFDGDVIVKNTNGEQLTVSNPFIKDQVVI